MTQPKAPLTNEGRLRLVHRGTINLTCCTIQGYVIDARLGANSRRRHQLTGDDTATSGQQPRGSVYAAAAP
jgi:hypothetical protein